MLIYMEREEILTVGGGFESPLAVKLKEAFVERPGFLDGIVEPEDRRNLSST